MIILILIDVQYSQKAVFSFEKGSDGQNYTSFLGPNHPVMLPPAKSVVSLTSSCYLGNPGSSG